LSPSRARTCIRAQTPTEADAQEALTPDGGAGDDTAAARANDTADGRTDPVTGLAEAEPHSPMEGLERKTTVSSNGSSERAIRETPPLELGRGQPDGATPTLTGSEGRADEQPIADAGSIKEGRPALPEPPADGLFPPLAECGELGGEDEEDMTPDLATDPLAGEGEYVSLEGCTYEFFSGLRVRRAERPDGDALKEKLRDVL
jgi:hypothetical protein